MQEVSNIKLRWFIPRKREKVTNAWLSSKDPDWQIIEGKPILQYSFDGEVWYNIPVVKQELPE